MRTISCPDCGHEIAEDDFIVQQCPVCDGYMTMNRLSKRVNKEFNSLPRSKSADVETLAECGKEHGQDRRPRR